MEYIKITEQMIDYYRSKPGNLLLIDSAIIDIINKDIEQGRLPKEFIQLAADVQKTIYNNVNSNLFGYGFDIDSDLGIQIERTTSRQKELDEINQNNYVKRYIENAIREETGNDNYKLEFEEYTNFKTENGIEITIDGSAGKPRELIITTDNKSIKINCHRSGIDKIITNKETNISTFSYYDYSGNILRERQYEGNKRITIYDTENLKKDKLLVAEIIKDLTNTNIFGFRSIRSSLSQNLEKITSDNILYVMEEYYKLTGQIFMDVIWKCGIEQEYAKLEKKFFNSISVDKEIPNLKYFLEYTGIGDELYDRIVETEILVVGPTTEDSYYSKGLNYPLMEAEWEDLTRRTSLEKDFSNQILPDKIDRVYNTLLKNHIEELSKNFVTDLKIENNKISNDYYKSNDVFDVQFGKLYEPIVITNKTSQKTITLDLEKITKEMSNVDKAIFYSNIQTYPAEVLFDMAIELDSLTGHSGNEKRLKGTFAAGFYIYNDRIITDVTDNYVTTHELGHAIDCTYINGSEEFNSKVKNFQKVYTTELQEYLKKGNKQYSYENRAGNSPDSYCTANEKEMFAECYSLLMIGECNSKDSIIKHFPNCLKATEELLKEIRNLPDEVRNQK